MSGQTDPEPASVPSPSPPSAATAATAPLPSSVTPPPAHLPAAPGSPIDLRLSEEPADLRAPVSDSQLLQARLQQQRRLSSGPDPGLLAAAAAAAAAYPGQNNNSMKTSFYIRDILDSGTFGGRRECLDTSSPELSDSQSTGERPGGPAVIQCQWFCGGKVPRTMNKTYLNFNLFRRSHAQCKMMSC